MSRIIFFFLLFLLSPLLSAYAKTVHYELVATQGKVNLSGKKEVDFALMINGQIPAPTLEFTEGDDAEIVVKNRIPKQELSIHWHGILLPPEMDGVPYVNTPPIYSGQDYTFRFKIRQHGTYWYHSHTDVQEQKGVYGAIVIHPKKETIQANKDIAVVISDWSDENPTDILKNLKKDGDYYLYKKGTMRSWLGAIQEGSLGSYLYNEWTRMGGMDLSDVGYDAFLINGKKDYQLADAHPGDKIRLRIINAAASSYFYLALGQAPMKVISADGVDIAPMLANEIFIGMAETYDVLFEVPDHKNYEFKITAQDGTGAASGWIGMGEKVYAPIKPMPPLYASMDHSGHNMAGMDHSSMNMAGMDHSSMNMEGMDHSNHNADLPNTSSPNTNIKSMDHSKHNMENMDHSGHNMGPADESMKSMDHSSHNMEGMDHSSMDMEEEEGASQPATSQPEDLKSVKTLTVDDLKAPANTEFPSTTKVSEYKLVLGGDMERYIWFINGKPINEERTIEIKEGEAIRFILQNDTMMHHPMHLHGHFFRVINKNGSYSPLKHTVDVPPHSTRIIEFLANEPGEWMLHCHNLYHLKTGMGRVVKYMSYTPKKEIAHYQEHDPHLHDHWYFYGKTDLATNYAQAYLRLSQTWNQFEIRGSAENTSKSFAFDKEWEYEGDLFYRRWINQYFNIVAGGSNFDKEFYAVGGVGYMLPFLVESNVLINHKGKFRVDLEKKFQWTSTLFTDAEVSWRSQDEPFDKELEYEVSLMYSQAWNWAVGLILTKENIGAGVQFQF